jgi:hypothetical protein
MVNFARLALGLVMIAAAAPAAPAEQPATRPTTQPTTQPSNNAHTLTAEQMLSSLLRPAPSASRPLQTGTGPAAIDKTSGKGSVAPGAPPVTVLREGSFVVDRIGRINRTPDGSQAEFVFEADNNTLRDPPMIVLPNLKLVAMENAVGIANRDLRFRITGMVTEYHGRNYLLLEKVVVVQDVQQQF